MKKIVGACLLIASGSALAVSQTTSTFTNINFNLDNYVSIDIPQTRVYMMLDRGMSDKIIRRSIEVPIYLDWTTDKGVKISASCSASGKPNLCKDHGLVEFPLMGMNYMYTDIYVKGSTKEYYVNGDKFRIYKGQHHIKVGVDAIPNFIKDYGSFKENTFLYKITVEARI